MWILLLVFFQSAVVQARETIELLRFVPEQACPVVHQEQCKNLRRKISDLWGKIEQKPSVPEVKSLRLELNLSLETLQNILHQDQNQAAIDRKYQLLSEALRESNRDAEPDIAYHHLELEAVQKIFQRFGALSVKRDEVGSKEQPLWQKWEVSQPWAGYWYPHYDPVLYSGSGSVFAKFDRMMQRLGRPSQAQVSEEAMMSEHPDSWEGLCNAWSLAAIMEREPQSMLTSYGETLTIADQKALLTKIYEAYPVDLLGIRYDGDYLTDGTYQDIRPEAFHRLALNLLSEQKKPFIIDDSAGIEVWQQPVFSVEWYMYPDEIYPNAYRIFMRLWKIKMRARVSDELTSRKDYAFDQYQYRLFVDPAGATPDGRIPVIAGEWLAESRQKHPDYVVVPKVNGVPSSFNPSLQNNMDAILRILHGSSNLY